MQFFLLYILYIYKIGNGRHHVNLNSKSVNLIYQVRYEVKCKKILWQPELKYTMNGLHIDLKTNLAIGSLTFQINYLNQFFWGSRSHLNVQVRIRWAPSVCLFECHFFSNTTRRSGGVTNCMCEIFHPVHQVMNKKFSCIASSSSQLSPPGKTVKLSSIAGCIAALISWLTAKRSGLESKSGLVLHPAGLIQLIEVIRVQEDEDIVQRAGSLANTLISSASAASSPVKLRLRQKKNTTKHNLFPDFPKKEIPPEKWKKRTEPWLTRCQFDKQTAWWGCFEGRCFKHQGLRDVKRRPRRRVLRPHWLWKCLGKFMGGGQRSALHRWKRRASKHSFSSNQ